jgi:hypothetical protein
MSDTEPLKPQNTDPRTPVFTTTPSQRSASDLECERLAQKILQGLAAKRSEESYEQFKERVVDLFREKGLFRKESPNAD